MEVSLLNVRITFQKNGVAVDGFGNKNRTWAYYYSCHATEGGEEGKQTSETDVAGTVADESEVSFTVRWCRKASAVDSTGYRVVFGGELYDILAIDHMNYKKKCIKFKCRKARR